MDTVPGSILAGEMLRPLVDEALADLRMKTSVWDGIVHFRNATWSVNQDTATIAFEGPKGLRAVGPVQIIGTFNRTDGTWLWAWDNPSVVEPLRQHARRVQEFGHLRTISVLTQRKLTCREEDSWEFTALACKLCDAQGAYRGPAGDTLVFMTFGSLTIEKGGTGAR